VLNQRGMALQIALIYAVGYWRGMGFKHQYQPASGIGVYMQATPPYLGSN
jgi:hypothetical protein